MKLGKKGMAAEAGTAVRLFSVYYFVIMLIHLFTNLGGQLIDTSRTLYVQSLGGSASFAGSMLTITAVAATVTRLLSGRASDKFGRRIIILIGLVIFCISAISFNVFPVLNALPFICLARGFGMGMAATTLSAAITDVIPRSRMSEGLGYYGLTQPLTSSIGPAIVAGLIAIGDFRSIYFISAGLLFAGSLVMFSCNYEKDTKFLDRLRADLSDDEANSPAKTPGKKDDESRGIAAFIEKSAIPCASLNLISAIASSANLSFLMAYAFHMEIPNPALYYTLSAVCMVVLRVLTGRFAARFKPVYLIVLGMMFNLVSFTFLLLSQQYTMLFYIAGMSAGIASGITAPVLQTTVVRMCPDSRRGAAMSTYMFTLDIGIAIGSYIWGVLVDNYNYSVMYAGCIICICIAIALAIILLRKVKPPRPVRR